MSLDIQSLIDLFERDLKIAIKEVSLYKHEEDLWVVKGDIANSGGNLALHIIGNLRHFIGHVIGKSDYKRNRKAEFESKDIHREELILGLQMAIKEIKEVLPKTDEQALLKKFPISVLGYEMTTEHFLIHLYGHLNYHVGQLNYHRRLVARNHS